MRTRILEKRPLGGDKFLEISIGYEKGGINYFSGGSNERGYYLYVRPIEEKDGMRSFMLFSGIKQMLKAANRFSDKVLNEITVSSELIEKLVAHVENEGHKTKERMVNE